MDLRDDWRLPTHYHVAYLTVTYSFDVKFMYRITRFEKKNNYFINEFITILDHRHTFGYMIIMHQNSFLTTILYFVFSRQLAGSLINKKLNFQIDL